MSADHDRAGDDQRDDGHDLDDGEPELHLAERRHRGQVQGQQQQWRHQGRQPQRGPRCQDLDIGGDRHDVRDPDHHPVEPVGPSHHEAGPRAEQIASEVTEGLVLQVGQQDLAHSSHDEEQHETDDHVDEKHPRPGQGDRLARTHEQAGPDGATDGDHLDVAVAELACQVRLLAVLCRSGSGFGDDGHGNLCAGCRHRTFPCRD